MEDRVAALARYRFEKAQKNLEVAQLLFKDDIYSVALNRTYYAVFDAMRAVNALESFDSSKHSGVIAHFNQAYVKTGIFPPEVSSTIRRASMLREKSDYEDFYEPSREDVEQTMQETMSFLKLVSSYLSESQVL